MGGGSSFSSGGPGKGITSLLYRDVLGSGVAGLEQSKAQYKEFSDSGIFYIVGLAPYASIRPVLDRHLNIMERMVNVGRILGLLHMCSILLF